MSQSPSLILTGPGRAVRTMMCWTSRQERSPLKKKTLCYTGLKNPGKSLPTLDKL